MVFDLFGMAALPVQGASASLKVSHNAAPQQNEGIPDGGGGGCAVVPTGAQQLGQAQHGPRSVASSSGRAHHVNTAAGAARRGTGPSIADQQGRRRVAGHRQDQRQPQQHGRLALSPAARRTGHHVDTAAGCASTTHRAGIADRPSRRRVAGPPAAAGAEARAALVIGHHGRRPHRSSAKMLGRM